jgi:hypothetical protein
LIIKLFIKISSVNLVLEWGIADTISIQYASASSDNLTLAATGTGDIAEMTETLQDDEAAYAYVRMKLGNDEYSERVKFAFVVWAGTSLLHPTPPYPDKLPFTHIITILPPYHPNIFDIARVCLLGKRIEDGQVAMLTHRRSKHQSDAQSQNELPIRTS